jgi:hypothetical protein
MCSVSPHQHKVGGSVKRYNAETASDHPRGAWVLYSDHLEELRVLREALREALDAYEFIAKGIVDMHRGEPSEKALETTLKRVAELRKLLSND